MSSLVQGLFKNRIRMQRVSNAVAAGTTAINSTAVNMADDGGYRNVAFMVLFGAITSGAVTSINAAQSSDNGSADDFTDLADTGITVADDDDNQIAVIDITRPSKDYVRCEVARATQNSVVDGIVAFMYDGNKMPCTHDASTVVSVEHHVSPAEGTA